MSGTQPAINNKTLQKEVVLDLPCVRDMGLLVPITLVGFPPAALDVAGVQGYKVCLGNYTGSCDVAGAQEV